MKIIATENTKNAVQFALDEAAKLYAGKISEACNEICRRLMKLPLNEVDKKLDDIVTKGSTDFRAKDLAEEIASTLLTDNFDETDNNKVGFVAEMLDVVLRIAIGQWDQLCQVQNTIGDCDTYFLSLEDRIEIEKIRNDFIGEENYFGIGSETLSDEVRMIYDFYKVWMYEMGAGGCYSFEPFAFSGELLPTITFKPQKTWDIVDENNIDYILKDLNEEQRKGAELDNGYSYFKSSDHIWLHPLKGEKLILKRNNLFTINRTKAE